MGSRYTREDEGQTTFKCMGPCRNDDYPREVQVPITNHAGWLLNLSN